MSGHSKFANIAHKRLWLPLKKVDLMLIIIVS